MKFNRYTCLENDTGRTLEKIVRKILPETSLNKIYQSIRNGLIKINGKKVKQKDKLLCGDEIWIADFFTVKTKTNSNNSLNYNITLENVFENEHIRIINKPYGYAVQGSKASRPNLCDIIKADYRKKNISSLAFSPAPLHRLDTYTTGLLVFSNSIKGAQDFSFALKNNKINKTYLAVLDGKLTETLVLKDFLVKKQSLSANFHTMEIQNTITSDSKIAKTKIIPIYTVKDSEGFKTFAQIQIETGRTHQIRLQCSNAGFPLSGDKAYGSISSTPMMLHCYKMSFNFENLIGLPCELTAPLREDFLNWTKKILPNPILMIYNIYNEIHK